MGGNVRERYIVPPIRQLVVGSGSSFDVARVIQSPAKKWRRKMVPITLYAACNGIRFARTQRPGIRARSHPQDFESPPCYNSYMLLDKYYPSRATLRDYVSDCAHSFECSPESSESAKYNEDYNDLQQRRVRMFNSRLDSIVDQLLMAWPCDTPPRCPLNGNLYDVESFTSNAQNHFASCYHNLMLKEHLIRVRNVLRDVQVSPALILQYSFDPSQTTPSRVSWAFTAEQLFSRPGLSLPEHETLRHFASDVGNTSFSGAARLRQLITTAEGNAVNSFQRQYISTLRVSAQFFERKMTLVSRVAACLPPFLSLFLSPLLSLVETGLPGAEVLMTHYYRYRVTYSASLYQLQQHLVPRNWSENALHQSGQWPRATPRVLLQFLASNSLITLSDSWKECLIRFASVILQVQRARRLLRLHLDNHHEELRRELQNEGCNGWNAEMRPDWLLIQVCDSCCDYPC